MHRQVVRGRLDLRRLAGPLQEADSKDSVPLGAGRPADDQDVLERGQPVPDREDRGERPHLADDHLGAGVGQDVADLLGGEHDVQRRDHAARAQRPVEGVHELGDVAEQQRHPVALPDPEAGERRRRPVPPRNSTSA